MIQPSEFKPHRWLSSRHLQTIWPMLARYTRRRLLLRRERLELPDGDFVDLDWSLSDSGDSPIVLFLHGMGGSSQSSYIQGLLRQLSQRQWLGVVMHFRGCGGERNRLARIYHSGDTADLAYVVSMLQKRYPQRPIFAIGFSIGGNILLKWLGEQRDNCGIASAVAVSVPFELEKIANYIQKSFGGIYEWWFIRRLKRAIKIKFHGVAAPIDMQFIEKCQHLMDFDAEVTAPLHGFADAMEYYRIASCRRYLQYISVPTLILHAQDDPLMPSDTIPFLCELSPAVTLELSMMGGHLGFVTSKKGIPRFWLDERVMRHWQTMAAVPHA